MPYMNDISHKKIYISNGDIENIKIEECEVGMRVYHTKFGKGEVLSLDGEGVDKKAIVCFEESGEKTLILRFAKLKKI